MNANAALLELQRLLLFYPGLRAGAVALDLDGGASVIFEVNDQHTLARLLHCAGAADLSTGVWARPPRRAAEGAPVMTESWADPTDVRYSLRLPAEAIGSKGLLVLGTEMIGDLARGGELARQEAERLLAAWSNLAKVAAEP